MFEKVFYSVAHFVFILHVLFALVLWLRARGSAVMRALSLMMGALALFFLLKLWIFSLPLQPLDLRPALCGGLLTMLFCMVPRIWFTAPEAVFRGSLFILLPAALPFILYGAALLAGVDFRVLNSRTELWLQLGRTDIWLRLLMAFPVFWYSVRSFRILCRISRSSGSKLARVYAWASLLFPAFYLGIMLDGSLCIQLCTLVYFLMFNGWLVYEAVFEESGKSGAEKFPPPDVKSVSQSVNRSFEDCCERGSGQETDPVSVPDSDAMPESDGEAAPDSRKISSLFARLERYMTDEEPWRNPELTLSEVVSILYTNRTSLSQAIREAGYAGFKEYVGYYRICGFKRLVEQGKVETLEQGFSAVGFRSKTTAFRHFSHFEEMTPLEYVRRHSPVDIVE